jgi:short subunit dehydrogenase-like uncharacterized protein
MSGRDVDVVLLGATGFAGRLTAEHLASRLPAGTAVGLAGRDETKLHRLRDALGVSASDWPLLVVDVDRPASVEAMAERATVVATTVGPYVKYGLPVVEACARAGTHYADLTGEVLFVRRSADAVHDRAVSTGARIVHACGFDAVPSDLGVFTLHEAATAQSAGDLTETAMTLTDVRGGISGGTFATMADQVAEVRSSAAARRLVADPYALSPDRDAEPDRTVSGWRSERDAVRITRDPDGGRWLAPFVMATYNTRIVRRSNALLGYAYGRRFRYQEWLGVGGGGPKGLAVATAATAGTAALAGGLMFGPTRSLLERAMPAPGEGPSERTRANGRFTCEFRAMTAEGARLLGRFAAHGDPGYAATAVMLGESALALALDGDDLPDAAGVLTPAAGIGRPLVNRLRANDFIITAGVA